MEQVETLAHDFGYYSEAEKSGDAEAKEDRKYSQYALSCLTSALLAAGISENDLAVARARGKDNGAEKYTQKHQREA